MSSISSAIALCISIAALLAAPSWRRPARDTEWQLQLADDGTIPLVKASSCTSGMLLMVMLLLLLLLPPPSGLCHSLAPGRVHECTVPHCRASHSTTLTSTQQPPRYR